MKCTAKMLISHISLLHVLKFWIIIWTYFYLPSFKLGRVQWTATCIVIILIKNYGWKVWVFEFFNTFTAFPFYIWIVCDFFLYLCHTKTFYLQLQICTSFVILYYQNLNVFMKLWKKKMNYQQIICFVIDFSK